MALPRHLLLALCGLCVLLFVGADGTTVSVTQSPPNAGVPEAGGQSRGEVVMRALSQAHPKRIGPAAYRNGDWAVEVRGVWYYYAEGRLLPETLVSDTAAYDPQPFYGYAKELPEWKPPGTDEVARMRRASELRQARPAKRSTHFFDAVWNVHNRQESWDQVKTIKFLGREVLVHHAILEELSMVEQRIMAESQKDPRVKQWADRLTSVTAWNWRNIADTQSRSNHSYGIAIDCLSPNQRNMETYWLWTAQKNVDWWSVPYTSRLQPPAAVIKAFEAYGFIWGGKWVFYDTMHFEYRPEILLLNGMNLTGTY
jgi:hypothetical protein